MNDSNSPVSTTMGERCPWCEVGVPLVMPHTVSLSTGEDVVTCAKNAFRVHVVNQSPINYGQGELEKELEKPDDMTAWPAEWVACYAYGYTPEGDEFEPLPDDAKVLVTYGQIRALRSEESLAGDDSPTANAKEVLPRCAKCDCLLPCPNGCTTALSSGTELEVMAEAVHNAYLHTCKRLGWEVRPSNQVPYAQLSDDSKELDRASVRAVMAFGQSEPSLMHGVTAFGWQVWRNVMCVECPSCGFRMDVEHTDDTPDPSGYSCPNCQITEMHNSPHAFEAAALASDAHKMAKALHSIENAASPDQANFHVTRENALDRLEYIRNATAELAEIITRNFKYVAPPDEQAGELP